MPIELLVYGCWWLIIRITIYLEELLSEIGIEPAIEDWIADDTIQYNTIQIQYKYNTNTIQIQYKYNTIYHNTLRNSFLRLVLSQP